MVRTASWEKQESGLSRAGNEILFYTWLPHSQVALDILLIAAFHGDEPESVILAEHFLNTVLPAPCTTRHIGVIPVLNPDGYKVRQRTNASGVDLNRNFPTTDWTTSECPSPYYAGPEAGSEPETRFLLGLLDRYTPHCIVSLHTPYKVINFDGPAETLAEAMAAKNGYPVVHDIGYATPGSFGTYTGKERHIPTITLELPEENFDTTELEKNLSALYAAITW